MGIITIIQAVIVMLGFHVQEAREVVGNTVTKRKLETLISFRGGTSKVEAVVSPVELATLFAPKICVWFCWLIMYVNTYVSIVLTHSYLQHTY